MRGGSEKMEKNIAGENWMYQIPELREYKVQGTPIFAFSPGYFNIS